MRTRLSLSDGLWSEPGFGTRRARKILSSVDDADVILVIGANPTDAHPVFGSRMKKRLREGAKLIVIDPRRIDLVRSPHIQSDYHLPLKPGTNVAMVTALAHVIVMEGLANETFIRSRCDWEEYQDWATFVSRPENSPEALAATLGVSAADVRGAARLYATGGNAAIYYGLGVTEHAQGSTAVMGIANLAMATGNLGRRGVGVNPLRGQNNVQGSCDMGSFPHELPGYQHISGDKARAVFEEDWGVKLDREPGLRIPSMFDSAIEGLFKGLYVQGEDILQSDPDTRHVSAALANMECVIVQDLFLVETANYAHVFLPGATFLEKDGTFTNAERRIQRIRKVMSPKNGYGDWEITQLLANRLGMNWTYTNPSEIMDEIARLTPSFSGVSFEKLDRDGSVQWPCNDEAPNGMPIMHVEGFARGKGKFVITEYVPTDEKVGPRFPLLLTTGRILSQYNVGAQTRRTENSRWHEEDLLEIHPHDAEERGVHDGDWLKVQSRAGETTLRAKVTDRVAPGVVYTTFHHPMTQANVITTDNSDWATNCPEYKVTAVNFHQQWPDGVARAISRIVRNLASYCRCRRRGGMTEALSPTLRVECLARRHEMMARSSRVIPEETPIAFTFGGSTHAVMMASPADLEDFAVGFALTEGLIDTAQEAREIEVIITEAGVELRAWLPHARQESYAQRRRSMAGPTGCGLCGIESLEAATREPPKIDNSLSLDAESLIEAMESLPAGQKINHQTRAVHAAGFWRPNSGMIAVREDVGRHNALDKLAGALARQGIGDFAGRDLNDESRFC